MRTLISAWANGDFNRGLTATNGGDDPGEKIPGIENGPGGSASESGTIRRFDAPAQVPQPDIGYDPGQVRLSGPFGVHFFTTLLHRHEDEDYYKPTDAAGKGSPVVLRDFSKPAYTKPFLNEGVRDNTGFHIHTSPFNHPKIDAPVDVTHDEDGAVAKVTVESCLGGIRYVYDLKNPALAIETYDASGVTATRPMTYPEYVAFVDKVNQKLGKTQAALIFQELVDMLRSRKVALGV